MAKVKKILFIMTLYRAAEQLFPVINRLHKGHRCELHLLRVNQMETKFKWNGPDDMRDMFYTRHGKYFTKIYDSAKVVPTDFDAIIIDDNRDVKQIQSYLGTVDKKKTPIFATPHGNTELNKVVNSSNFVGKRWSALFVFGQREVKHVRSKNPKATVIAGGIPLNDNLASCSKGKKHLLVIPNFLENQNVKIFKPRFGKNFIQKSGMIDIAKKHNIPIIVKVKCRSKGSPPNHNADVEFVKKCFQQLEFDNYSVIRDHPNVSQLIADSKFIISAPSTLTFAGIQLGIPTAIIKGAGQIGNFKRFKGLVDLDKAVIENTLNEQLKSGRDTEFVDSILAGGSNFTSTQIYVREILNRI